MEAERSEKQRRKEAAAAASQALFSLGSEELQKHERELHKSLFPHLNTDDDGDAVTEEHIPEDVNVMEEID